MGKDKQFKDNFRISGYRKLLDEQLSSHEYYNPDLAIENNENIIVLEHSSSGDRKVHIGELCQFIEFARNSTANKKINMILLLDGAVDNSPKAEMEFQRLKYYVDNLFKKSLEKVGFIGVAKYDSSLSGQSLNKILTNCNYVYKK
jgi:hypothetical protein